MIDNKADFVLFSYKKRDGLAFGNFKRSKQSLPNHNRFLTDKVSIHTVEAIQSNQLGDFMKLNVFVGLLLSPLFSLAASPAVYKATTLAPVEFRTISVDWITLNKTEEHSLRGERMDIGSTNVLFNGLYKISDILYNAADKHEYFTGEKILVNKWDSGCGYGYRATATVIAKQPIAGFSGTIKNNLKIRVKILDTNDTCHSNPSVTVIEYKLAK